MNVFLRRENHPVESGCKGWWRGRKKEIVDKGVFFLREIENGIEAKIDKALRSNYLPVPEALECSGYSMLWQFLLAHRQWFVMQSAVNRRSSKADPR